MPGLEHNKIMRETEDRGREAVRQLTILGYRVTEDDEGDWVAEAGALRLMGESPLVLLGLHGILATRGWGWSSREGEPDLYKRALNDATATSQA